MPPIPHARQRHRSVIAHIDHGLSTIGVRILELTHTGGALQEPVYGRHPAPEGAAA
jgi:translation elongation factor EF-4